MNQEKISNKPNILYRGVVISYDKLDDFDLEGDLVVPYEPIIDGKGEKTVFDGNEYGVYMTTNQRMVYDVYGNVHGGGKPVQKNLTIGDRRIPIAIPDIAISYEIDTDGVSIRQPKITSVLAGHYNNGFSGEEWIADEVPNDKYKVTRVRIGKDVLHDHEDIPITDDMNSVKEETKSKIQERKLRLTRFASEIEKISDFQRRSIDDIQMKVFKDLFGQNGVCYTDIKDIDVSSNIGKTTYLMSSVYNQNTEEVDYKTLKYIEELKKRLSKLDNPEDPEGLRKIISDDMEVNNNKRQDFVQRKLEEGISYTTVVFDKRNDMMSSLLNGLGDIEQKTPEKKFDLYDDLRKQVNDMSEQFKNELENDGFGDKEDKRREQDYIVEKTDDDFIM